MQGSAMTVRLALKNDLERVNILRKQVNDIHVDQSLRFLRLVSPMNSAIMFIQFGVILSRT